MNTSELTRAIEGVVLEPGDAGFDDARALWNAKFDRRPEVIARCATSGDVAASVNFAREHGMKLSVKGGGHSYAAKSVQNEGLLIDLSPMTTVDIDVDAGTVVIQAGVTCADLDRTTQAHGLATPLPAVSSVGVIGAALGGGSGYLSRKYGLTLDNIVSARLVTANGQQVRAAADDNVDLFWAIRGGGGNFGIVTDLELRLHEVGPRVLSGQIIHSFDRASDHLRFFRDYIAGAPHEFQCFPYCFRAPPVEPFPAETHGHPVIDFVFCHQDPSAADFVQPLRSLDTPILDLAEPTDYVTTQTAFDAGLPKGQRYISKAHNLDRLSDEAIDLMVEFVPQMVGAYSAAYFEPLGAAVARVPIDATPYAGRDTEFGFHIVGGWTAADDDNLVTSWARRFHAAMDAHGTGGVYVNLIADDEDERIPAAYAGNYQRLVELKRKWDPDNLFSSNYNIPIR